MNGADTLQITGSLFESVVKPHILWRAQSSLIDGSLPLVRKSRYILHSSEAFK